MRLLNRYLAQLFLNFAVLALMMAEAAADPSAILAQKLDDISSIQAQFVQTTHDSRGDVVSLSEGQLVVGSNARFSIQTSKPYEQSLVSNGSDFYTYDPDLEQVIIRALVRDVKQVPILLLGDADPEFLASYHITLVDELNHSQFLLIAKASDSVFEQLNLKFVGVQPTSITLRDSLGQVTDIQLSNVVTNAEIDTEVFQFTAPAGVDVIDDR